jgi:PAS domain S-box-containing protein
MRRAGLSVGQRQHAAHSGAKGADLAPEELLNQRDTMLEAVASCAERLLRAMDWEQAIDDVLRELGQASEVSRAYVFRFDETEHGITGQPIAEWAAPGIEPQIDNPRLQRQPTSEFPGLWEGLSRGEIVQEHVRDLGEPTRSLLADQDIRSILLVPLMAEGRCFAALGFDECVSERDWSTAESETLRTAAGMLTAAIQRREADRARLDAERRYRTLVESLPLTTYIDNVDDEISSVYISPQIKGVLGYAPEEWLNDPGFFGKVVHPDDRPEMLESAWPEDDGPHRREYRMIAKDGSVHWFIDEYAIVRNDNGQRLYAQGYLIDITERKQIEEELKRTNDMLHALVHSSPIGIVFTDREEKVVFWNEAAEQIYGFGGADAIGQPLRTRPPGFEAEYAMLREGSERGEKFTNYLTKRLRSDGSLIDVVISSTPIRDASGSLLGVLTIHSDVTEERQAEAALRESEQHFRSVFDNTQDAIAILDDDRRYVEANQSYLDLFRTTRERLIRHRSDHLLSRRTVTEVENRWRRFLDQGEISEEVEYKLAGGERLRVELRGRANFLPGRHLLVMRNVTEQRALESQLLRTQRLEAVGQLAGGIAHDFNNLLTAISGYSEFLLEGLDEGDALRRDAEEIRRAADVAAALVRQLLAFSRRQMLQPRTVDLNAIVHRAESLLRRLIGEDIVLAVELAPMVPAVRADPAQVEQIIVNLAVNARDAMPQGGTISLRTEAGVGGRRVRLVVSDTGTGMDEHTRLHAFDPFFTTKEPGKGTGLGLATVYGIVTQSGGTIELESQPGRGTTFRIDLPALPVLETPDDGGDASLRSAPGKETVLLVEDEDIVRSLTERVLVAGGYRVLSASHGQEALDLLATAGGEVDLLLTDVVMPGMSGTELAECLTAARPDLRVLFTSGYSTETVWERDGDRTGFIAKPFTPEGLRQAVRTLLEEQ